MSSSKKTKQYMMSEIRVVVTGEWRGVSPRRLEGRGASPAAGALSPDVGVDYTCGRDNEKSSWRVLQQTGRLTFSGEKRKIERAGEQDSTGTGCLFCTRSKEQGIWPSVQCRIPAQHSWRTPAAALRANLAAPVGSGRDIRACPLALQLEGTGSWRTDMGSPEGSGG